MEVQLEDPVGLLSFNDEFLEQKNLVFKLLRQRSERAQTPIIVPVRKMADH